MSRILAISPVILLALFVTGPGVGGDFGVTARQMLRPVVCKAISTAPFRWIQTIRRDSSEHASRARLCMPR